MNAEALRKYLINSKRATQLSLVSRVRGGDAIFSDYMDAYQAGADHSVVVLSNRRSVIQLAQHTDNKRRTWYDMWQKHEAIARGQSPSRSAKFWFLRIKPRAS